MNTSNAQMVDNRTIIDLESRIEKIIDEDNLPSCTVHFKYEPSIENTVELSIITHNPVHKTDFLLYKSWGLTEQLALESAYRYLSTHRNEEQVFTVQWKRKGNTTTNTSYFSGHDMSEVLDKFYHGKNKREFIIFYIKLNPIS